MGKKLGGLIRAARTKAGFTQEQLARKVSGATQADIGRFERGEAEPTTQVVKDIAKACGVTQKSLLDAMPKSQARTSHAKTQPARTNSGRTSSGKTNSGRTSTAQKSSMQVTATEKRLVELYRKADSETRKKALALLRGDEGETVNANDILSSIGDLLSGVLFKSPQRSMAPLEGAENLEQLETLLRSMAPLDSADQERSEELHRDPEPPSDDKQADA